MAKYVRAEAVATHFNVTPETVRSWHRRGLIPGLRAGRRPMLFDLAEVEKALRDRAGSGEGNAHVQ